MVGRGNGSIAFIIPSERLLLPTDLILITFFTGFTSFSATARGNLSHQVWLIHFCWCKCFNYIPICFSTFSHFYTILIYTFDVQTIKNASDFFEFQNINQSLLGSLSELRFSVIFRVSHTYVFNYQLGK